jgi:uncharacterized protein YacL
MGLEQRLRAVPGHHMVGALIGGVVGLFGARLVWGALDGLDIIGEHFVHALVVVFLGYMGVVLGGQKAEWFEPARIIAAFRDSSRLHQYKVLDTSSSSTAASPTSARRGSWRARWWHRSSCCASCNRWPTPRTA